MRLFLKMSFHFLSVALTSLKLSLVRSDAFIGNIVKTSLGIKVKKNLN